MELTKEKREQLAVLPTGNVADNNNSVPRQGVMDSGIKPVDPKTAPRYMQYIPFWA